MAQGAQKFVSLEGVDDEDRGVQSVVMPTD